MVGTMAQVCGKKSASILLAFWLRVYWFVDADVQASSVLPTIRRKSKLYFRTTRGS
jgi:hypothetical protein